MRFGISNSVRSRVVRECTPERFHRVTESKLVAEVCAEIEDALEQTRRGEMSREDFEAFKAKAKKRLPIFTPHATFKNGRRLNAEAVPSGMSMYDIDHISDPRGYFETNVRPRVDELGVVLAHVTPSTEGLRLFFIVPQGMTLAEAQRWMSEQLGDKTYDQSVKDYARSSFAVPKGYILYWDEEKMFCTASPQPSPKGEGGGKLTPLSVSEKSEKSEKSEQSDKSEESEDRINQREINQINQSNQRNQSNLSNHLAMRALALPPLSGRAGERLSGEGFLFSRASLTRTSLPSGSGYRGASLLRASATTSCTGWLRICAISRITMRS
jgi:hypothetical protein